MALDFLKDAQLQLVQVAREHRGVARSHFQLWIGYVQRVLLCRAYTREDQNMLLAVHHLAYESHECVRRIHPFGNGYRATLDP